MMKFSKVGIKLKMMKFLDVGTNDDYFFRVLSLLYLVLFYLPMSEGEESLR